MPFRRTAASRTAPRPTRSLSAGEMAVRSATALCDEPCAVDAMLGPGQSLQAFGSDRLAASQAAPERPGVEADKRRVHEGELLLGTVAEGEIALLLEDVARRRRLRPVRHLARRLDRRSQFLAEAGTLGFERPSPVDRRARAFRARACGGAGGRLGRAVGRWGVHGAWWDAVPARGGAAA